MKTRKVITRILSFIISLWLGSLIVNTYESYARAKVIKRGPPPGYCILQDEDGKFIIGLERFEWHHYGKPFNGSCDYIYKEPWMISLDKVESLRKAWHHYESEMESDKLYRESHVRGSLTPVSCNSTQDTKLEL